MEVPKQKVKDWKCSYLKNIAMNIGKKKQFHLKNILNRCTVFKTFGTFSQP